MKKHPSTDTSQVHLTAWVWKNKAQLLIMLFLLFFNWQSHAQTWNNTYSDINKLRKGNISGIAQMGSSHYIIQSTDGAVSKIDLSGNVVWSISDCDIGASCGSEHEFIQGSVAVKGNKILVINKNHWKLIVETGGAPSIALKRGWQYGLGTTIGFPTRVKLIDGDFFICGGLYKGLMGSFSSPNFVMRVNDVGAVLWSMNYDNSPGSGGTNVAVNLITDVEMWTENRIVATHFQTRPSDLGGFKTNLNVIDASSGAHLERININLQSSITDPTPNNSWIIGFWDLDIQGNDAHMVGYIEGDKTNAMYCNYDLSTHSISSIRYWSVPERRMLLTNLTRVGSDYYVGGAIENDYLTVVGDAKSIIIKCNATGSTISEAYEMDNTNLKFGSPFLAPTPSCFFTDGSTFMLGSQTENDLTPVVRKSSTLDGLGCLKDLNISVAPWNYLVEAPFISWAAPLLQVHPPSSTYQGVIDIPGCCLKPTLTVAPGTTICEGETTIITATGSGVGLTYSWIGIDGAPFTLIAPDQIETPELLTPGIYQYCVTITDENGCSDNECIYITVVEKPDVSDIDGKIYCLGSSYTLPIIESGGVWSGPYIIPALDGINYFFSSPQAGVFVLTYCSPAGCCVDATVISGGPALSIVGELDLCEGSPTTLTALIGIYPDPVDILWSPGGETTASITVTTPGTYTVTVTGTESPYCSTTASVEVLGDGRWHKTTENSDGTETSNDIITDSQGNVFVTGYFTEETELQGGGNPNMLLDPLFSSWLGNMYVAKYNKCGTLIWVAHSTESPNCSGNSIVLDESNGMVYVAGDIMQFARFHNSLSEDGLCTSGSSIAISPTGTGHCSYVAQYDMATGCLYFVEPYYIGDEPNTKTIAINEFTGDVFVGGQFIPSYPANKEYAFLQKFSPTVGFGTSDVLGPVIWSAIDNVNNPVSSSVVNDLDFDEANNLLYGIGTFQKELNLFNGSLFTIPNSHSSPDAFLMTYTDLGLSSLVFDGRKGKGNANGSMEGNGISIQASTGAIFMTGTYIREIVNPFYFTGSGINPLDSWSPTDYAPRSYMIGASIFGAMTAWSRQAYPSPSETGWVFGKDVVVENGNVYFLSEFSGTHIISMAAGIDGSLARSFIGDPNNNSHLGLLSYSTTGNRNWMNATESPSSISSDDQKGNSITHDSDGHCFIAGSYNNNVSYYYGTPASGDLVHSGVSGYNAMIIRIQNIDGELLKEASNMENTVKTSVDLVVKLFPNPNSGWVQLELENFNFEKENYQMTLLNFMGEQISVESLTEKTTLLNLNNYADGVYFVQISDGSSTVSTKIIKQ